MATDNGTGETWRARRGHDDLVIAVSMAGLYLENPGPNMGIWELCRRQAGAPLENYCVAVDFGQSVDNCAICVMSRSSAPAPEPAAVEPVEQPTGGIVDLPARIQQPVSAAPPPALGSPEWHHQVAEGQKAILRRQGFSSSGPLKATRLFLRVPRRRKAVPGRSDPLVDAAAEAFDPTMIALRRRGPRQYSGPTARLGWFAFIEPHLRRRLTTGPARRPGTNPGFPSVTQA